MDKRKLNSPLKVCQYGTNCFRVNPVHFDEYSHPHLDSILETDVDEVTGEYVIPTEYLGAHKMQEQLTILNSKVSRRIQNPSKVQKTETEDATKNPEGLQRSMKLAAASTSGQHFEKHETTSKKPGEQKHPEQVTQKEAKTSSSVADFFKERREAFKCKNPEHMQAASPAQPKPVRGRIPEIPFQLKPFFPLVLPTSQAAEKLRKAPYNILLTAITASSSTHVDSNFVTFLELLDPSLGELESSVQLNFTVDINWLLAQYTVAKLNHLPLVVLYGSEEPTLKDINQVCPNVTSFMIHVPGKIGCHHAKVMLFFYKDKSMRVVVSTSNLYQDDWHNRVQGIWMSDRLPELPQSASKECNGESVTKFRADLVRYLTNYRIPTLQPYIERVMKSDFSSVKVFLITSIPGTHRGEAYGHPRLAALLKQHSAPIDDKHSIIMQSSSLGNFGKSASAYLTGEVAISMKQDSGAPRGKNDPDVKLIYPSLNNVKHSHDGIMGGGCLPYYRDAHRRQPWLNKYLYQWNSKSRNCDRAMPHIKSYCRYSDDGLFWFVLTSANMSKSAWGVTKGNALLINSYEVGVAFFPRVILDGKNQFPMNEQQQINETPILRLPFDVPPVPYERDDAPFCIQDMSDYQEMLMAAQAIM